MLTLNVEGMTCGHCAKTVTKAVEALPSVERALVDLDRGTVTVEGKAEGAADEAAVRRAIEDAGYEVRGTA